MRNTIYLILFTCLVKFFQETNQKTIKLMNRDQRKRRTPSKKLTT